MLRHVVAIYVIICRFIIWMYCNVNEVNKRNFVHKKYQHVHYGKMFYMPEIPIRKGRDVNLFLKVAPYRCDMKSFVSNKQYFVWFNLPSSHWNLKMDGLYLKFVVLNNYSYYLS